MLLLYTAAHGVPGSERFPLGGGAAICRMLRDEWSATQPFPFRILGPELLGANSPSGADLVRYSESDYARFCRRLEAATTEEILRHDPRTTVVLANDVSEGPAFRRLAAAGYSIATIYHVDVVAYIANIYLRGWLTPQTTVRCYDALARLPLPNVLRLVWEKQRDSVECSRKLIVPSAQMVDVMRACYPHLPPEKFLVLPWGSPTTSTATAEETAALRNEFAIPPDAHVLLALSRISPEKGQDLLLEALLEWERQPDFPTRPVYLFLCGEAAFMKGRQHLQRLQSLAARLRRVKTFFPGHVTGPRKAAFFSLADLYVFPSRHESYGLTLMEAFQAGLPAVTMDHHGARELMRPEFGAVATSPTTLWQSIAHLLTNPAQREAMSQAVRSFANTTPFSETAALLAKNISQNISFRLE